VILYYALGGGLGHLTRARKVLEALRRDAVILTASPFGGDRRVTGPHRALKVPRRLGHDREAFRRWLAPLLREADELIVDTFPGGILGELCGLELPPATLVARRLRWDVYEQRLDGPLPRYDVTYEVEPLGVGEPLTLPQAPIGEPLSDEPHWLVVHAGPGHELDALIDRARGAPELIVITNAEIYPVAPHLSHAERVITGGGFNAVHENARWRERHTIVPFPRALDDQFARAQCGRGSASRL
jgi:predicted glycosyltransferase